jgi:molybdenum storage protein
MKKGDLMTGDGRLHLDTELMGESLVRDALIRSSDTEVEVAMVPDCTVVMIGGRSLFDRGRDVVYPLVEQIVEARKEHPMLIGVSGGARLRHVFHVGLDLGIPTGGLAQLAGACEEQNVAMLQILLGRHNAVHLKRDHFSDLPLYLKNGMIPLTICVPPYHFWEPPAPGRLPSNGSDLGLFMTAEALGAPRLILLKDQEGLFTDDPETNPDATFIPRIGAAELEALELPSLIVDRELVATLRNARFTTHVQVVNGLVPGNLTRALAGEPVGTVIYRED